MLEHAPHHYQIEFAFWPESGRKFTCAHVKTKFIAQGFRLFPAIFNRVHIPASAMSGIKEITRTTSDFQKLASLRVMF